MISLRPYEQADLETLYRLDQACFRSGIAYSKAELRFFLNHPRCLCLVAASESRAVAGFTVAESFLRNGRRTGHIVTIDVAPDMRRLGVGSLLMEGMEAGLRAKGAIAIRLEVAVDNLTAQAFYRKFGYEKTGQISGYYLGSLDALVMQKQLS